MPAISVIVPVYKVEKYIHRCVDSILDQTFTDFELILVDDGSPDNCGAICDEYAAKDSRVEVIHQENGGLSAARNAGIDWAFANSDSEWITYVDSDDWIHPEMLEILYTQAKINNLSVTLCNFERATEYKEPIDVSSFVLRTITPESFFVENFEYSIVACGKLYKKRLFESIRYPVGTLHEDGYVTHRVTFSLSKIGVIELPLYSYYANPNSITHTASSKRLNDALIGQRERKSFFKENNFKEAYDAEINHIVHITTELNAMNSKLVNNNIVNRILLLIKLRHNIHKQKIDFHDHIWLYELAYPVLMRLYWIFRAGIKKVSCFVLSKTGD